MREPSGLCIANNANAKITLATIPTPNAGVNAWIGKRNPLNSEACSKIPYATEQGIIFEEQGAAYANQV